MLGPLEQYRRPSVDVVCRVGPESTWLEYCAGIVVPHIYIAIGHMRYPW